MIERWTFSRHSSSPFEVKPTMSKQEKGMNIPEEARLTDAEIDEAMLSVDASSKPFRNIRRARGQAVVEAQLAKAVPIIEAAARKSERERIIAWGEEVCPHGTKASDTSDAQKSECLLCWQAFKEGK